MSDDEEGEYNTITHTETGRGVKLLYSKSKKGVSDGRPTSSSSHTSHSPASSDLLLAWLPESSLGDAASIYVKVDLTDGDSPPKQSYLVPSPPTVTTHRGSIGHYAFAIPVGAIYSLLVRPPSLGWWFGSVVINTRAGDSFPALFFHDSECQSTILQKKKLARESFDPFGENGQVFWGGDEVLRWLRRYVRIERSAVEPNIYLVEPSKEDSDGFGGKANSSTPTQIGRRDSSRGMTIQGAAGASTAGPSGQTHDGGMDPVMKFVKETGWNIMEKFSKVTTFTRKTAQDIIDNPKIPPQVRRLMGNPEVQTIQSEFDSARIYLARWAMGIAEQSEKDRTKRIWTARDVMEMEDTDVGEFELLETNSMSLEDRRNRVTLQEWKGFFDSHTGRLSMTIDEVKERIFHGGLDPDDGVRKEAWLFLLGVYDWYSTSEERRAQLASLRDEYVKLKASWWERLVDLGGEGEEGEWWREQRGRIELIAWSPYLLAKTPLIRIQTLLMQDDAIAFWGFQHFMDRMERNFLRDQSGMRNQLLTLDHLVAFMDPKLYAHLQKADSTNFFFFFRMLLVWYKREFKWMDILHLWEVLWTDYLSSSFHLFIALAILEKHRDVIMAHLQHFDEVLKYSKLKPKISPRRGKVFIACTSLYLFRRFQRLIDTIDKKQNFPAPRMRPNLGQSSSPSSASPLPQQGSGKAPEQQSDKKTITPELRKLLSRNVEILPRKVVHKQGDGFKT
ncbi:hypothetical protein RRF57_003141 [Xylaria bambusicola]|uniref:Rab-GAP TBC domain-containing protein n=1 Tax=Xylaria bambusicola TaxID=326684 RepID=A0AAN7Z7E0_9PEZI